MQEDHDTGACTAQQGLGKKEPALQPCRGTNYEYKDSKVFGSQNAEPLRCEYFCVMLQKSWRRPGFEVQTEDFSVLYYTGLETLAFISLSRKRGSKKQPFHFAFAYLKVFVDFNFIVKHVYN